MEILPFSLVTETTGFFSIQIVMQRCRWSPMPIFRACATCENSDRHVPPKKVDKNNILSREIRRFLYFTTISLSTCAKSVSDKSHKQESVDAHWCDCRA